MPKTIKWFMWMIVVIVALIVGLAIYNAIGSSFHFNGLAN
jgi:hypothetical protein